MKQGILIPCCTWSPPHLPIVIPNYYVFGRFARSQREWEKEAATSKREGDNWSPRAARFLSPTTTTIAPHNLRRPVYDKLPFRALNARACDDALQRHSEMDFLRARSRSAQVDAIKRVLMTL